MLGTRISGVSLRRRDVLRADRRAPARELLLDGGRIDQLRRHGKHLAIITTDRRVLCIHLGMSGRLQLADWLLEEGFAIPGNGSYHHVGTTRMSTDPRTGVVDPSCRVHGMHNLFIAGSSVFPTEGFANPTLTIIALGLRLADHLKSLHV